MASFRALRPTLRQATSSLSPAFAFRRCLHERVPLAYSLEAGVNPFLSPSALKTVAVDWQQGILSRLNELVRGTEYEGLSVLQTVRQTASDPTQTLVFNYASEALNNSFFLSTLTPNATPVEPSAQSPLDPNHALSQALRSSPLKSFPSLVSHFSSHVAGLHPSSGAYIWLVVEGNSLGVVGTYAGGTVLVHERKQLLPGGFNLRVLGETLPEAEKEVEEGKSEWVATEKEPKARTVDVREDNASRVDLASSLAPPPMRSVTKALSPGTHIYPLLCLSVHPHCYLADYGVWGREEYVKNWWKAVDWKAVEENFEKYSEASRRT